MTRGSYYIVKSPFDSSPVAEIEKSDAQTVEQAFCNAEYYFGRVMKRMPAYERAEILYGVARLISENIEDLARTIALEGGKPIKDARVEAIRAVNTVKMSADCALSLNGEQITMDRAPGSEEYLAYTTLEPIGPILAISAFNHPVNLICHQVATAIAAGNTVLVKPASQTPVSCFKIIRFFHEAGLPEGIINILTVPGSAMDGIVADPRLRFISFIGSADVGWNLSKRIAPGVRLALEHGGTAASIVTQSADALYAAQRLTKGAFYHAGQVCVSTQLIFAHDDIYEDFLTHFIPAVESLSTGDPTKESTDVGPLIARAELERVARAVAEAQLAGANALTGAGKMLFNCYSPTVLEGVTPDMEVFTSEIFGPVVSVIKYTDIKEVERLLNSSHFSFQTSIFTRDIDEAMSYAREIEQRTVIINDHTAFRVDWMPFGGSKHSGLGTGGVKYSVRDLLEEKLTVIKRR